MKKKERKILHKQNLKELNESLKKTQLELVKARMEKATAKVKDVYKITKIRKKIAVIKTIIRERELK